VSKSFDSLDASGNRPSNLLAIAAMIASTLAFLLGDTTVKLASENLPVPQIIAVRGILTSVLVIGAAIATGVIRWSHRMTDRRILLRAGFDAATTLMFLQAIANMPIADATAIINAVPIVATVLAVLLLKEYVGFRRWTAIILGFVGMLLVVRPSGEGLNLYGLLACAATLCVAGRDLVTRGISREVPSLIVTLASALMVTLAGGLASAATGSWVAMGWADLSMMAVAALFLFAAYHFSVIALRLGEVSLVGPFRYTVILWGLIVGYIVWGDVPGRMTFAGMALITLSGLYVIRREYGLHRQAHRARIGRRTARRG
jgi:drug/metabolite transporter (DMT)-like permease